MAKTALTKKKKLRKLSNIQRITQWLENHWVMPAYSAGVLLGIALCFFAAATNTMAGWLYVLSGMIFALLLLGAILPRRSLRQLKVHRYEISPVSAGDQLSIEIGIENPTSNFVNLLELIDLQPLTKLDSIPIEVIRPKSVYSLIYYIKTIKRGVYRWDEIKIKTATPLGLFWSSSIWQTLVAATVYPMILPLNHCPLIDTIGKDDSLKLQSDRRYQAAQEGITKTLRPYRYGDPFRLIHWRSSARFEEFKVRELETVTGGQEIIICLDSAFFWQEEAFEEAVIAAASLYFYASRAQLNVKIWTAVTGLVEGNRVVLEALAAIESGGDSNISPPFLPLIWLTQNPLSINSLPDGSRWLLFPAATENISLPQSHLSGLLINSEDSLQIKLQEVIN